MKKSRVRELDRDEGREDGGREGRRGERKER